MSAILAHLILGDQNSTGVVEVSAGVECGLIVGDR